jgi:hypothetical protein
LSRPVDSSAGAATDCRLVIGLLPLLVRLLYVLIGEIGVPHCAS